MTGLTGIGPLLRLAVRRDRWMIGITLGLLFLLTWYSIVATQQLYPDPGQLRTVAEASNRQAAIVAMYGRIYDTSSVGGLGALKNVMLGAITSAILCIAVVRRHTRADEETGRYELLGSGVVGRYAALAAAVTLAVLAAVASGALVALAGVLAGTDAVGSLAQGVAVTMGGLAWTGLTAVAVQLTSSNRSAGAMAFGALGLAFGLRAVGDVREGEAGGFLRWVSPLGWAQQVRPYGGDRFAVVVLSVTLLALCLVVAVALLARRDPGHGVLPDRGGPARGRLAGVGALAWRLQRGGLLGWLASFALMGVLLGFIADSADDFIEGSAEEYLRSLGGAGALADLYMTALASMTALLAAACGIALLLRVRGEEEGGHAELLLATAVSRWRLLASHAVPALVGAAGGPVLAGAVGATVRAARDGRWGDWERTFGAFAVTVPAVLVLVGVAVLAVGLLPRRAAAVSWGVLAAVALLQMLGESLGLPGWLLDVSPFRHVPRYPVEAADPVPLLGLGLVAVVALAVGAVGYRRRDIG